MKQLIASNVGDEQIRPAVVIIITDGYTHAIARASDARLLGHIGKGPVMVVVKQPVPVNRRLLHQGGNCGSIHDVYIEIAVPVIVEKSHAGHHSFNLVFVWGWGIRRCEVQSGLCSNFFKPNAG